MRLMLSLKTCIDLHKIAMVFRWKARAAPCVSFGQHLAPGQVIIVVLITVVIIFIVFLTILTIIITILTIITVIIITKRICSIICSLPN